jgi:hypothetical protein
MSLLRCRRGQIVIPALFIFPSLMLFVYLIYETAKLSREKIRHQFAIDAASFVEMANYSDFLNRTAYVNGAFPMRIFEEGFKNTCYDSIGKANAAATPPCTSGKSVWDMLYDNGAFPRAKDKNRSEYTNVDDKPWDIGFGGPGESKNESPPEAKDPIEILSKQDATDYWLPWEHSNDFYKLYVQVYKLLGSVEEAQYSVLTRLADGHGFFKKSYWMNTGDADAERGAADFDRGIGNWSSSSVVKPICHKTIQFHGNQPTGSSFRPYQVLTAFNPQAGDPPLALPDSISGCQGLFQLMWVNPRAIDNLRAPWSESNHRSRGIPVSQPWTAPGNYFNHDFNTNVFEAGRPAVHVTVSVGVGSPARVWPDPTPKFQVRTYP